MIELAWLKKLKPGTVLVNKNIGPGFWLVYHTEVQQLVGPWCQLHVWMVESARCRLNKIEMEAGEFEKRWTIIDVSA
jgi:hypothetical protein